MAQKVGLSSRKRASATIGSSHHGSTGPQGISRAPNNSPSRSRNKRRVWRRYITNLFPILLVGGIFYLLHRRELKDNPEVWKKLKGPDKENQALPRILHFTHYADLLRDDDENTSLDPELHYLRDNVKRIISLHPGASYKFFLDKDCVDSLQRTQPKLIPHFLNETQGMYKADICRGSMLLEFGGLYFDVDLGVRENIFQVLKKDTTFATVVVHAESLHKGAFFQAFMAATPNHPVIQMYLDSFLDYYEGRKKVDGPLGVQLLRYCYGVAIRQNPLIKRTAELWQEVKYIPEFRKTYFKHVPPPTWGTRRACKFVVVSDQKTMRVPMYSRIAGSRMCPALPLDTRYLDLDDSLDLE